MRVQQIQELRRNSVRSAASLTDQLARKWRLAQNNRSARLAQAAGIVSDLAADGLRNIWWFLNAPQAVAQVAMFQGMRNATQQQARGAEQSQG